MKLKIPSFEIVEIEIEIEITPGIYELVEINEFIQNFLKFRVIQSINEIHISYFQ